MASGNGESAVFAARYEYKYLIDPALPDAIRRFIKPFMEPDPYAARCEGNRYPICSLYLDSPDLLLYNQVHAGEKTRYKLRVRTYNDDPRSPAFFEIKKRQNRMLYKRRAALTRKQAARILDGEVGMLPVDLPATLMPDLDFFLSHSLLISARPVVRVRYVREAYESRENDPVRITFDSQLMHSVTLNNDLSMRNGEWVVTPVPGAILEIKFTNRFPSWVQDMVHLFGLKQDTVPKYVWSVDQMLGGQRKYGLNLAGRTLPPTLMDGQ